MMIPEPLTDSSYSTHGSVLGQLHVIFPGPIPNNYRTADRDVFWTISM